MSELPFITDVNAENFASDVVHASAHQPVLVDFWAPWCGPCRMLMPVLEQLAAEYQGQFRLAKVNIDEQQGLAAQFGIRSVPTVKLFRHGQPVDEFMGVIPESQIRALLDRYIERVSDKMAAAAMEALEQGDGDRALALLCDGLEMEPDNYRLQVKLGEALMALGRTTDAASTLQALPLDIQLEPDVVAMMARLEFAQVAADAPPTDELEQQVREDPSNSLARHQLAARKVLAGQYEEAMEQLLEILRRDRGFGDDAGRKGLLKVFELLGNQGPAVTRYRQQMSLALH